MMNKRVSEEPSSIKNQIEWFDSIDEQFKIQQKRKLIDDLEKLDLEIKNSSSRKISGWKVHSYRNRQLTTSVGLISFRRIIYKRQNPISQKWEYNPLLDSHVQIEKYQKLSYEFKSKLITKIASGTRANSIINSFPKANLNKSTISRFISKLNIKNLNDACEFIEYKIPKDIDKYDTVYISTDDSFPKLKINNKSAKHRIRLGIMYLGISSKPDFRNSRLIHKRVVYTSKDLTNEKLDNVAEFVNLVKKKIKLYYGDKDWNIVVSGDGDRYIKSIANYLNAKIVMDKFHMIKEIKRVWPQINRCQTNREMFHEFKYMVENHPQDLLNKIDNVISVYPDKKERLQYFKTYLQSNLEGVLAWRNDWYNGCYAESNVWHYVKSITKGKSYGIKTFMNILNLRTAYINDINPIELWRTEIEFNSIQNIDKNFKYKLPIKYGKNVDLPLLKFKTSNFSNIIRDIKNKH